jgi:uroporphyrinogen-III synthase
VSRPLLILRPEPGASETAARARRLGLEPVVAPLFTIVPLAWEPPDPAAFDALLLTSANAARHAGRDLEPFLTLPCWTVGDATAAAAREAEFADVRAGPADGAALAEAVAAAGVRHALHLHGREHVPLSRPGLAVEGRAVYAAEAVSSLPEAARGCGAAIALIHSPRAGALFAALVPERMHISLAAISPAAAVAAGPGWADVAVAAAPRDEALLELAAKLCNNRQPGRTGAGGPNGL